MAIQKHTILNSEIFIYFVNFRFTMCTIRHRGLIPIRILNLLDPAAQAFGLAIYPFLSFMRELEAVVAHKPRLPILSVFGKQNTNPPFTVANQKSGALYFPHGKKFQPTANKCQSSLSRIAQLVLSYCPV